MAGVPGFGIGKAFAIGALPCAVAKASAGTIDDEPPSIDADFTN